MVFTVIFQVVLAALAGAFCYAVAAALQHHEAARATTRGLADPRLLWQLAHRPLWLAGIAATGVGASLHLLALSRGPLTLVQPLGVTGLLFAVPLAAALRHHRVQLRELMSALIVLAGLGALLGALPVGVGTGTVGEESVAVLLVTAGALAAAATAAARLVRGSLRSLFLAIGAGIAFGSTSALARVLMHIDSQPGAAEPMLLAGAGIALLAPLGFLLTQSAYRAGGFAAALATITVVDPVVAVTGGVLLLHEPVPTSPGQTLAVSLGAVLITVGIAVLARSPAHAPGRSEVDRSHPPSGDAGPGPTSATKRAMQPTSPKGPLRVLIGTDTYHPDVNGAAYFTFRLATGLAARGHDVHVICPSADGAASTRIEDGVTVYRLPSVPTLIHPTFRICPPPRVNTRVRAVLDDVEPSVVHVQGHFPIGRSLLRAAHKQRLPLVATNHFMPDNLLAYGHIPAIARRLVCAVAWWDFTRMFNRAEWVTTPTPIAADLIRNKGLQPPIQVISCGIDLDRFHTRADTGLLAAFGLPDRATLLFVGRLDEEKRLQDLVGALPAIRGHVDAQIVLVGTGTQQHNLAVLADQLGVAEHVHFLGFVPDDELPRIYTAADVFVMPGVAELQSVATLEAMASGLPIIAADAMALPHLVHPGINGFLYRPGDVDAVSRHGLALLAEPPLRHRMGRASREIARTHDAAVTLAEFEDRYTSLGAPVLVDSTSSMVV